MCHPETCTCWNYRIKDHKLDKFVDKMDTDSCQEADTTCARLNAGLVQAWVDPEFLARDHGL